MAETLLSPGVLARENDLSQVTQFPVVAGAAFIGPTVKGPVRIPTLVTSYSDYVNKFGDLFMSGSQIYNYFTSIAAYNYFNNGGRTALVTRVVSGTYTPATASISGSTVSSSFVLETLSQGIIMNSTSSEVSGALASGSTENLRWEIAASNTGSGVFTLLIRRGDDTSANRVILESYIDLSLDPFADNYISKVIGDQRFNLAADGTSLQVTGSYPNMSKYVRVSAVTTTPNYINNAGIAVTSFTGSIPKVGSGSFGGASGGVAAGANFYETVTTDNIQGLSGSDYTASIRLLSNKDDYQFTVLSMPGLTYQNASIAVNQAADAVKDRGDAIFIMDLSNYGTTQGTTVSNAAAFDNSYVATYWPWVRVFNRTIGRQSWVPASTLIPAVYAYSDSISAPWFAPAGLNRGALTTVQMVERRLTSSDRDTLYSANINPIATFPNSSPVVYGQKTLQRKASALDRVNVRRLLIELKSYIGQIANTLVFEQNSATTRGTFLGRVNPYLENIQQRQGLYAFRVVMDESNNTADVIDRNQLVGAIYIQPTRTAEFIVLDFNILPTGATFPS